MNHDAVRTVVTRAPHRKVGLINCRWFQRDAVEHESQLERRFVFGSLLCRGLNNIQAQPFTLQVGGRRYTPDFLLSFGSVRVVVEVKIARRVSAYREILDGAEQLLARSGMMLYVVTEAEIDYADRSQRAMEILRYAKSEHSDDELMAIGAAVPKTGSIELGQLEKVAKCSRSAVLHAVARHHLTLADIDAPLSDETLISHAQELSDAEAVAAFEVRFRAAAWACTRNLVTTIGTREPMSTSDQTVVLGPRVRPLRDEGEQPLTHPLRNLAGGL